MPQLAKRTLGITLGDPTGIGPELVALLLCDEAERARWDGGDAEIVVYGDQGVLARAAAALGLPGPPPGVRIEPVTALLAADARPGRPCGVSGAAQVAYLEAALRDAAAGRLAGLCTAPIHKASAMAAGMAFPGHTELLAARLLPPGGRVVMMLCGPSLRVALCTAHVPLAAVPGALTVEGVAAVIELTARALVRDLGVRDRPPRLWVAGLNPHAGEAGHLGSEEQTIIAPAMERARAALPGVALRGPEVPDAMFRLAVRPEGGERPDAIIAMYHDQGLIPLKLLDFDEGVNVTLGLPLVRTSPDHGTAHDIAGTGRARPGSMAAALRLCREMMARRAAI